MSSPRIRFSFAVEDGPNTGLCCPGWRVWTSNEDTYVTGKTFGGVWKASLHGDVAWRFAVTREHVVSGRSPNVPGASEDRVFKTFTPPRFVDGHRLAFVVAVARGCMLRSSSGRDRVIPVADRWDQITLAKVWMSEAGVSSELADDPQLVGGPLPLASGRRVWVTWSTDSIEESEPQPLAVGAVVKVLSPEDDGVGAPGFLVVGANWG